jgi:hypothetical protein
MNCTIHVDTINPTQVAENEPFKVTWTLAVTEPTDLRGVVVTLLTDDARIVLFDQATHDSPPEKQIPVTPGMKTTKTSTCVIQRRRGLIDEVARDGSSSPVCILARVKNERDEVLAYGPGRDVQVTGLARRPAPRVFA